MTEYADEINHVRSLFGMEPLPNDPNGISFEAWIESLPPMTGAEIEFARGYQAGYADGLQKYGNLIDKLREDWLAS